MTKEARNKVVVPVVLLFGIFIGGVVVLQTKGIGATILTEGKKLLLPVASDPDADPDNDGLKNWEEDVYHTDQRNPDTDGDGYIDGEEVASGYDPTIPAPNDALPGTDTSAPRPLPKNLTTHLVQLLTQDVSSGQIDPTSLTALDLSDPTLPYNEGVVNDALAQIAQRAKSYFTLPIVTDADIIISQNPTTYQEIGVYIAAMGQAVKKPDDLAALNVAETDIISEAVSSGDVGRVQKLADYYQQTAQNVKGVTAPQDFADLHKRQLAILLLDAKIFGALADFQNDPATAAAAMEIYPSVLDMLQQFSSDLNTKISSYQ